MYAVAIEICSSNFLFWLWLYIPIEWSLFKSDHRTFEINIYFHISITSTWSTAEICVVCVRTTGKMKSSRKIVNLYGKLTSPHFGRAISAMNNPHSTNIHRLRDGLFSPKNRDHIPAIKVGVDHESVAIDAYQHITGHVVKPTSSWIFHNNFIHASSDGLLFTDPNGACAVGILEVKCPNSMRDVELVCDSEWHHHLHYLDCNNELKNSHDY